MAVWYTDSGHSPVRCGKSQQTKLSEVTKGNQLEALIKKDFPKNSLEAEKLVFKNLKINDGLNEDAMAMASVATSS